MRRRLIARARGIRRRGTALPPAIAAARDEIRRLGRETDGPIVAGPWLSEVGYELLYWIPFLRWAVEREPGLPGRLVAVSRGGTRAWYGDLAADYVELFDLVGPDELRRLSEGEAQLERGGLRKQVVVTSLDRRLIEAVRTSIGTEEAEVLHPATMYGAFLATLKRGSLRPKELPFRYAPLAGGEPPAGLPSSYVAVRFYFSASFPDTQANRELVREIVEHLTAATEIVLLNPGRRLDDHPDYEPSASRLVHRLDSSPATNLALQTAVIGSSEAFVGTYGGLSYLAPLLGRPAVALYSEPRFRPQHLELARRVFSEQPYGRFVVLDRSELELVRFALGGALGRSTGKTPG